MARRRMFSLDVIDTDLFLDMSSGAQNLYFHLAIRADDDGFIQAPKKIMKITNAAPDDMKILVGKGFVIPFNSGICVIKHWKIHNLIRSDRYTETHCKEEKAAVVQIDKKYELTGDIVNVIPHDTQKAPQVRLVKVRKGKDSIDKKKTTTFKKPTIEEIKEYCTERNNNINAESFYHYYESKGWMIGKSKMKAWKSAVITWEKRDTNEKGDGINYAKYDNY